MSISNLFKENDDVIHCKSIITTNSLSFASLNYSQIAANAINTPIIWINTQWQDIETFFQTSDTEIVILKDGYYLITLFVPFQPNGGGGERTIFRTINDVNQYGAARVNSASTTQQEKLNFSIVENLSKDDTIKCFVYQTSGTSCTFGNTVDAPGNGSFLSITKLA